MNRFERLINYSPAKIVPDGGAHVRVIQVEHGRNYTNCSIAPAEFASEGEITLETPKRLFGIIPVVQKETVPGGTVTVPEGATADVIGTDWSARVEVHKNNSPPMVRKTGEEKFHHVNARHRESADMHPNPLYPQAGIWWENEE
jgi:hypothetical protein